MANKPDNPINLSVHQSSDPSLISPKPDVEASGDMNDLNDSVHDDENVDVPSQQRFDDPSDENPVHSQTTIANLSAG
jgi:hypothetical protein